jgi:hypothetical protein
MQMFVFHVTMLILAVISDLCVPLFDARLPSEVVHCYFGSWQMV